MRSVYNDPSSAVYPTWLIAGLVAVVVHIAVAAYFMQRPLPEPKGAVAEAVLVDLTPPKLPPAISALQAAPPAPPTPETPPQVEPAPVEAKLEPPQPEIPTTLDAALTPPSLAPEPVPQEVKQDSDPSQPVVDPPQPSIGPANEALVAPTAPNPSADVIRDAEEKERSEKARAKAVADAHKMAEAQARRQKLLDDMHRAEQAQRDLARRQEARTKAGARGARDRSLRQSQAQAASPAAIGAWQGQVRARILANVIRGAPGSANVVFTVTSEGSIAGASVSGEPQVSAAAISAVRRTGSVQAPPDHQAHALSIRINVNER